MTAVLLIDDDVELSEMLSEYLVQEGYQIGVAYDGVEGLQQALTGNYQLAVLDVMMPRMNGIETLRKLRTQSEMPVIMLTARGDDMDKILGLELGADDYVPKPCSPRELSARIRAILRRLETKAPTVATAIAPPSDATAYLEVDKLRLWHSQRRAEWSGKALELTSTEYNLLAILARHAGEAVSKEILSEQGLGRPLARFDRSIDVHISSIRQKLGSMPDGRSYIQTVYRQGYVLIRE